MLTLLVGAALASPEDTLIILDASGSMVGFCTAPVDVHCSLYALVNDLREANDGATLVWGLQDDSSDRMVYGPVDQEPLVGGLYRAIGWRGPAPFRPAGARPDPCLTYDLPKGVRETNVWAFLQQGRDGTLDGLASSPCLVVARPDVGPRSHASKFQRIFVVTDGVDDPGEDAKQGEDRSLAALIRELDADPTDAVAAYGIAGLDFSGEIYVPRALRWPAADPEGRTPGCASADEAMRRDCEGFVAGRNREAWPDSPSLRRHRNDNDYAVTYRGDRGLVVLALAPRSTVLPVLGATGDRFAATVPFPLNPPTFAADGAAGTGSVAFGVDASRVLGVVAAADADGLEVDVTFLKDPPLGLAGRGAAEWRLAGAAGWRAYPAWAVEREERCALEGPAVRGNAPYRGGVTGCGLRFASPLLPATIDAAYETDSAFGVGATALLLRFDAASVDAALPPAARGLSGAGGACMVDGLADWADPRRPHGLAALACHTLLGGKAERAVEVPAAGGWSTSSDLQDPAKAHLTWLRAIGLLLVAIAALGVFGVAGPAWFLTAGAAAILRARWRDYRMPALLLGYASTLPALASVASWGFWHWPWVVELSGALLAASALFVGLAHYARARVVTGAPVLSGPAAEDPPVGVACEARRRGGLLTTEAEILGCAGGIPLVGPPEIPLLELGPVSPPGREPARQADRVALVIRREQQAVARLLCARLPAGRWTVIVADEATRDALAADLGRPFRPTANPGLLFPAREAEVLALPPGVLDAERGLAEWVRARAPTAGRRSVHPLGDATPQPEVARAAGRAQGLGMAAAEKGARWAQKANPAATVEELPAGGLASFDAACAAAARVEAGLEAWGRDHSGDFVLGLAIGPYRRVLVWLRDGVLAPSRAQLAQASAHVDAEGPSIGAWLRARCWRVEV